MRDTFFPFSPPLIGEEEIAEVRDTLRRKRVGMTAGSRIGTHV